MSNFFDQLDKKIASALEEDFHLFCEKCAGENIYACALVTDSSAMSLFFALNSEEALKRRIEENGNEAAEPYVRWSPSDWSYGDHLIKENKLGTVSNLLLSKQQQIKDGNEFYSFKKNVHKAMISALQLMNENDIFEKGNHREKITIFVSITDDTYAEEIENISAKILNPPKVYNNFVDRYETVSDIKEKAENHWKNKDYDLFISLFEKIKEDLSDTELKKLLFAKKKIND